MSKISVDISTSSNCGIIIECPSGIVYMRQTGGININNPELEGSYLPYDYDDETLTRLGLPKLADTLWSMFSLHSKYGGRSDSIDEKAAVDIDGILEKLTQNGPLSVWNSRHTLRPTVLVDRTMLHKSQEAWVYVTIRREDGLNLKGVFTWENSD